MRSTVLIYRIIFSILNNDPLARKELNQHIVNENPVKEQKTQNSIKNYIHIECEGVLFVCREERCVDVGQHHATRLTVVGYSSF